jgi:transcriptional regulator with XRE-family HTH domain
MNGNLKKLREQRVLSLTDLAQIAGVNRVTINRIENGKQKAMPRTLRKLAEALQVSVEELRDTQRVSHSIERRKQSRH